MVLTKQELLARDGWQCQYKGCSETQNLERAHRIHQGSTTIRTIQNLIAKEYNVDLTKKEAEQIMHDEKNIAISCSNHNSTFNIYFKRVQMEQLIIDIYINNFSKK